MKNFSAPQFLVTLLLLGLSALASQAQTIRRVNNNGITGTNIYATMQLAINAATAGDIIQVEPSTTAYAGVSCTKQLSFVGPGYFLGENAPPALQASPITAVVGSFDFQSGSAGSSVSGLVITSGCYVRVDNFTITRCQVGGSIILGYAAATTGAVIRQNYVDAISQSSPSTNSLITNNIIINGSVTFSGVGMTGEFSNNTVINTNVSLNAFTVRNNYFNNTLTTTANTAWSYNLFTSGTPPTLGTSSNNTASVPLASVFVLSPGAQFDGWYKLKTGTNPATGGGQGGIDVGATGSATGYGYRFGGQPAIPAIYQLGQSVTGNNLNVTLGTRSNN